MSECCVWSRKVGPYLNRASYRQIASTLMIVTGLVLVLVNMLGFALAVSVVDEHHEFANDSVPGYGYSLQDTSRLQGMLREPMTDFDLETVNNTIFESLVHSDKRTIHIYENALLWLGGALYEPLSRTQNPRRIVSGGVGLCSDVSTVLKTDRSNETLRDGRKAMAATITAAPSSGHRQEMRSCVRRSDIAPSRSYP